MYIDAPGEDRTDHVSFRCSAPRNILLKSPWTYSRVKIATLQDVEKVRSFGIGGIPLTVLPESINTLAQPL